MDVLKPNNFIFVAGVPGSGKTRYCLKISKVLKVPFLDDPINLNSILKFVKRNPCGIVCSPNFCISSFRKKINKVLKSLGIKVQWHFFEKKLKACILNDKKRKGIAGSDIFYFNLIYRIPSRSKYRIPVYVSK